MMGSRREAGQQQAASDRQQGQRSDHGHASIPIILPSGRRET